MSDTLNLLPTRVAIGYANGVAVYPSPEFTRLLTGFVGRVGGVKGVSTGDLATEMAGSTAILAQLLGQAVASLQSEFGRAERLAAELGELRKRVASLEQATAGTTPPTDWEHPGKIGAAKADSGQFTTLNRVTITAPLVGATLTLLNGKTFTVSNTLTLAGTDGSTLNIGAGGTLGTAAYAATGAFAARSATALAGAATDAATTQALANSLRSVLLSVGIGS